MIIKAMSDCIFKSSKESNSYRIPTLCILFLLFSIGVIHWIFFFNFGNLSFGAQDWPKEFKYYSILQQSIKDRCFPYYVSRQCWATSFQPTDRFLAIPEIIISPQVFLLSFLKVNQFLIVNIILLYAIGYLGCLFIKRRYHLSLFSFGIFYLIFNFNGHIISHLAVGHSMWGGYFLLPYFLLSVFKLVEENASFGNSALMSFTLFFIFLQGSFHIYIWCLIFLILLCATQKRYRKPVISAIMVSMLFSAFRLLPAVVTFFDKKQVPMGGYHTIEILLSSLIAIKPHTYKLSILKGEGYLTLGWWEYDLYISILGLIFLSLGIYWLFFGKNSRRYHDLKIPLAGQTTLSLGVFYALITLLPIPFVSSERVSTRLIIIPFLVMTLLSALYFQEILDRFEFRGNPGYPLIGLVGILQLGYSLLVHSVTWSLINIEKGADSKVPDLTGPLLTTGRQMEKIYMYSLKAGALISITALLAFVYLSLYKRLRRNVSMERAISSKR